MPKKVFVPKDYTIMHSGTFGQWQPYEHESNEQVARYNRARTESIEIIKYAANVDTAQISGTTGNVYTTTLDSCTCEDYRQRGLPCKHMYKLAMARGYDPIAAQKWQSKAKARQDQTFGGAFKVIGILFLSFVVIVALLGKCSRMLSGSDSTSQIAAVTEESSDTADILSPSQVESAAPTPETIIAPVYDFSAFGESEAGAVDITGLSLKYGDLKSVNYNPTHCAAIVEADISDIGKELTIEQNYYNVCALITDNGFNTAFEIHYLAKVDGTKVVSFTLDSDTISGVYNGFVLPSELGDCVIDLYLAPQYR